MSDVLRLKTCFVSFCTITVLVREYKGGDKMTGRISSGQYLGYLAYFNRYSVDGYIGPNELTAILERAGRDPSDQEVRDIISHVSTDARGITFQAFINYVGNFNKLRNVDSEFREAFRLYDRRGLGRLYKEDLEYVFQKLRVSIDVDALFKAVDLDSSGTIEYNEFVEAMKKAV